MPAKLEIEVIDRGTAQPQGGAVPSTVPGTPQPAPVPPGQSQFPPGSVGDQASRWQQTGALNTGTGNTGPAPPVIAEPVGEPLEEVKRQARAEKPLARQMAEGEEVPVAALEEPEEVQPIGEAEAGARQWQRGDRKDEPPEERDRKRWEAAGQREEPVIAEPVGEPLEEVKRQARTEKPLAQQMAETEEVPVAALEEPEEVQPIGEAEAGARQWQRGDRKDEPPEERDRKRWEAAGQREEMGAIEQQAPDVGRDTFDLTGKTARAGWKHGQGERPAWEEQAQKEFAGFNDPAAAEAAEKKQEQQDARGMDRLLWQTGLGKLGNLMAMADQNASLGEDASSMQKWASRAGVVQAASGVVGQAADAVSGGVRGAGNMASSIVQNDPALIGKVADQFENLARKVPLVGEALGGVVGMLLSPARALADVFGAMTARGKELEGYSGEIAGATAQQEVKLLMADIKEAQENGADYARLIEIETDFQIQMREFMLPIKKFLLENMVAFIEWLRPILDGLVGSIQAMGTAVNNVGRNIDAATGGALTNAHRAMISAIPIFGQYLGGIEQNTRPKADPEATMANLYEFLGSGRASEIPQQADIATVRQGVGGQGAPIVGGP